MPIGANARDIVHFVELLGLSPMEAILAATKLGGEIMRRGHELGQIRPGFLADLLLVDGDPVRDVGVLTRRDKFSWCSKAARSKSIGAPRRAREQD